MFSDRCSPQTLSLPFPEAKLKTSLASLQLSALPTDTASAQARVIQDQLRKVMSLGLRVGVVLLFPFLYFFLGPLETQWAGQPGWARSLPGQGSGHGRGLQLKTTPAQGIPTPPLPWPPIRNDSLRLVPWGLDLVTQEQASPSPSQGHSEGRHHLKC